MGRWLHVEVQDKQRGINQSCVVYDADGRKVGELPVRSATTYVEACRIPRLVLELDAEMAHTTTMR